MIYKESWYGEIPPVTKPSLSSLENQILREWDEGEVSEDAWRELAIQVSRAGVFPLKLLSHQELFPEMLAQILDDVRDILPEATVRDLLKRVWEDEGTWEVAEDWMFYESEKMADRGDLGFFAGISITRRSRDKRFHEKAVDKLNEYIFKCRLMSWGASASNADKMTEKFQEGELAYHHNYGRDLHLFDSVSALEEAALQDYGALRENYAQYIRERNEMFFGDWETMLTEWVKRDHNWAVIDFWSDVGANLKGLSTQPPLVFLDSIIRCKHG